MNRRFRTTPWARTIIVVLAVLAGFWARSYRPLPFWQFAVGTIGFATLFLAVSSVIDRHDAGNRRREIDRKLADLEADR